MQYIDVDEIVMEHYQSTCTSQPSVSEFPQIAPSGNIFASKGEEKPCLPPELYSNCSHGVKVWLPFLSFSTWLFHEPIGFLILLSLI